MSDAGPVLLEFPGEFPIKIFGRNRPGFRETALFCLAEHGGETAVSERLSREGNFVSLTVTVRAESRDQLEAIYAQLRGIGGVLMVL